MTDWLTRQANASEPYEVLRLIDAVLARAAKLKKQEERQAKVEHG
jgi:hypothetical protein